MSTTTRYRQAKECLGALRLLADDQASLELRHPDQHEAPFWQAADLQVIPNESLERPDAFATHQLVVFTRHAAEVSWVLYAVRDALRDYLTPENKSLVFGQIGLALRRAQAGLGGHSAATLRLAAAAAADLALEAFAEAERLHARRAGRGARARLRSKDDGTGEQPGG